MPTHRAAPTRLIMSIDPALLAPAAHYFAQVVNMIECLIWTIYVL